MNRNTFDNLFSIYFQTGIDKKRRYVTFTNAARIISQIGKRKQSIEDWPTLYDLAEATDLDMSGRSIRERYTKMIQDGVIKGAQKVPIYNPAAGRAGTIWKIPPKEYKRLVAIERDRLMGEGSLVSLEAIADMLDYHPSYIGSQIKKANMLPLEVPYGLRRGNLFTSSQVNQFFVDKMGMTAKDLISIIGRGFQTEEIARKMSVEPETVRGRIWIARMAGILRPYKIKGRYFLTEEEAHLMISRSITIPGIETLRKMQKKADLLIPVQDSSIENELWSRYKHGDDEAFNQLLELYHHLIMGEATRFRRGLKLRDRIAFLQTELFILFAESEILPTRPEIIRRLERRYSNRLRIEGTSTWRKSLDEDIKRNDRSPSKTRYVDLLTKDYWDYFI